MASMLLPGRYAVVAILATEGGPTVSQSSMPATDRESLEKLRSNAKIVTAVAGQTATLQLQLKK